MNPAVLVIWAVVGVLILIIAVRFAILLSRLFAVRSKRDEVEDSPFYKPRR